MLKLKLQYFGHLMWRTDSLEKSLMLGKIEGRRRRGWQRMRWLDSITNSLDMSLSKLQEMVKNREAWHAAVHGITKVRYDWVTEQQQGSKRPGAMCSWSSSSQHLLSVGEGQVFSHLQNNSGERPIPLPHPPRLRGILLVYTLTWELLWEDSGTDARALATERYKESKSPCPALREHLQS